MISTSHQVFVGHLQAGLLLMVIATATVDVSGQEAGNAAAGQVPASSESAQNSKVVLPPDNLDFDFEAEEEVFKSALQEWRDVLTEMREEMIYFHNGPEDEMDPRRKKYRELEKRGWELFDKAYVSATRLLENVPSKAFEAAQFLVFATRDRFEADLYEFTGEGAKQLVRINAETEQFSFNAIAGISLLATNQFDEAEPLLRQAYAQATLQPENAFLFERFEQLRSFWEKEQQQRVEDAEKGDLPRVRLTTTRGDIVIELFEDQAPNTVANFIRLVEDRQLDDVPFFQVVAGMLAMAGITDESSIDYCIRDEAQREDKRHLLRGTVSMFKIPQQQETSELTSIPNTASQQFFFALKPLPHLDAEHTAFGRVIEGMTVLSALTRIDPSKKKSDNEPPVVPDRLVKCEVIRKRDHAYEPEIIEMNPMEMVLRGGQLD